MSLQVWLPLNGSINNNGLSSLSPIPSAILTYNNNGKIGKCFQSGSQYISLPLETIPETLSICVWVKPNSPNAWTDIFSLGVNDNRMEVSTTTQYYWYCDSSSTPLITSNTALFTLNNSVWNHVCMTADGTTVKFYLNGIIVKTVSQINSFSTVFGSNLKINIGARIGGNNMYSGYMNDFRIYNHCLSAKEVKEISKGLVCHYPLKSQYETGQVNKYSGDVAEGSLNMYGAFTKTKLEGERGYNYKFSYTGNGNDRWDTMNAGSTFSFTAGKKYYYSCKVRCHSTNFNMYLRASRSGNDWVTNMTNVLNPDGEWHEYVVYQTINSTYDRAGSTVTCNPILEFYTDSLLSSGYVYSADFDIKDIQVIESDCYVPFIDNDMVSNVVSDCSGYGNNGTKVGTIAWSGDSARYSGSYFFNVSGIYKDNINLTLSNFTISYWLKRDSTTGVNKMFFGSNSSSSVNAAWYHYGDNSFKFPLGEFYYNHNAGSEGDLLNQWVLFTFVYDGSTLKVYRNSVYEGSKSFSGNVLLSNLSVGIGYYDSGFWSHASMSDFRIYSTALSEEDVKSLYNVSASIDKTGVLFCGEICENEGE